MHPPPERGTSANSLDYRLIKLACLTLTLTRIRPSARVVWHQEYTSAGSTRAAALLEGMELLATVEESLGMRGEDRGIAQARDHERPSRGWGAVRAQVAPQSAPPQSHRSRQLDIARILLGSVETSLGNDAAGSLSARGGAPAPLPPISVSLFMEHRRPGSVGSQSTV